MIAQDNTLEPPRYRMSEPSTGFVAYITRAVLFLSRPVGILCVLIATRSDVDLTTRLRVLTNPAYVYLVEHLRLPHLIKVAPMPIATTEFLLRQH